MILSSVPQQRLHVRIASLRDVPRQGLRDGDESDLICHNNCKFILVCILLQQPSNPEQLRCALCIAACKKQELITTTAQSLPCSCCEISEGFYAHR